MAYEGRKCLTTTNLCSPTLSTLLSLLSPCFFFSLVEFGLVLLRGNFSRARQILVI